MDNKVLDQMMMALMGASPTDDQRMANLDDQPVVQILPDANVVKIGGQSFIDRGRCVAMGRNLVGVFSCQRFDGFDDIGNQRRKRER